MRILVSGAAGFIGSFACERLLGDGHRVVGLDNFDPFYDRPVKEANLAPSLAHGRFAFVEADIRDSAAIGEVFAAHGAFDAVVHLAARAGVRPSIRDPIGYEEVNVRGTMNLLEHAARGKNRPRFIFGSSSSVYGNSPKVPFSESDNVDRPISPYAATKKAGELVCHAYHHLYGLATCCLRFFTVYGPRQRPDLAIHKFARNILAGKPIQVFGDLAASRDYTYVDDVVLGISRAVERCDGYEIINLGSSRGVSLRDMIAAVSKACNRRPIIEQMPPQPGDVARTWADVEKAGRLLGYRPTVPFEEGIERFVEWLGRQKVGP